MGLDGPQLAGIAAIIVALTGGTGLFIRGRAKQKVGVPASEVDIESNLVDDKRRLQKDNDRLQALLTEEANTRRAQAEAAENRRIGEQRLYRRKIDELGDFIRDQQEVTARNRRRFIEKYGEEELKGFLDSPELDETWTAAELREFKRLSDEAAGA